MVSQGSLLLTGRSNRYIHIMIEFCTRYALAVILDNQSAKSVASAVLGKYVLLYGTPPRIFSDQKTNIGMEIFQKFCKLFSIKMFLAVIIVLNQTLCVSASIKHINHI